MRTDTAKRLFLHWAFMAGITMGMILYTVRSVAEEKAVSNESIPGLAANLKILNMGGAKSKETNELYTAIFKVLAQSPAASFADIAKDTTVQAMCAEMGVVHLGGPMLGCIAPDSVKIWIRTTKPAKVSVDVVLNSGKQTFGPVASTLESDLTAIVPISGLKPASVYEYKVFVDGKEIAMTGKQVIKTPPSSLDVQTRIVFGTCTHGMGLANVDNFAEIRKFNPHAMLIYGDIAVMDRTNNLAMHRADYVLRDFHPPWNDLVGEVPIYASWDDHDYSSDDAWGLKRFDDNGRRGVRKVFTQSWNNPYYGLGDEGGGIFTHTRIGCCDVIMTDNRYFRQGGRVKHAFLGPEQMKWLKETLLACKGPFIIITCGTMWDDVAAKGKDSWGIYDPEGREEIYRLIEEHKIPGVLFLSGDRHGARIFRIPRQNGHEFYEFEVAGLGGRGSSTAATNSQWNTQLYGIMGKPMHGQFIFDTSGNDPTVTFKLVHAKGNVLYEITLTRSQLTPK